MKPPMALYFSAFLCIAISSSPLPSHAQVPNNVLLRTLEIKTVSGIGTAFTIDIDHRQYLITAKHVIAGTKNGDKSTIAIRRKSGWIQLNVTVYTCNDPIDIAVLVPPTQITVNLPLEPTSKDLMIGQDAYFAGFPYGQFTTYTNMPWVFPLVKRATVAQFIRLSDAHMIQLDAYNNPGFSGSPIVYRDLNMSGFVYKVAGVLASFVFDAAPVIRKKQEIQEKDITAEDKVRGDVVRTLSDGKFYRVEDTDQLVKLNTGIAQAWGISSAVELIREHPIGPQVSDNFTVEDVAPNKPPAGKDETPH